MEIILLQDVPKVGKEGATVKVKPGFARNFLMPRGLALPATPEHARAAEERQRRAQGQRDRIRKQADALRQTLESTSLTLTLALGEGDKAFGSVTVHDIIDALAKAGLTIEKHAVGLAEPIKALGMYDVPVRLHPEVTATLKVWIVKQQ